MNIQHFRVVDELNIHFYHYRWPFCNQLNNMINIWICLYYSRCSKTIHTYCSGYKITQNTHSQKIANDFICCCCFLFCSEEIQKFAKFESLPLWRKKKQRTIQWLHQLNFVSFSQFTPHRWKPYKKKIIQSPNKINNSRTNQLVLKIIQLKEKGRKKKEKI